MSAVVYNLTTTGTHHSNPKGTVVIHKGDMLLVTPFGVENVSEIARKEDVQTSELLTVSLCTPKEMSHFIKLGNSYKNILKYKQEIERKKMGMCKKDLQEIQYLMGILLQEEMYSIELSHELLGMLDTTINHVNLGNHLKKFVPSFNNAIWGGLSNIIEVETLHKDLDSYNIKVIDKLTTPKYIIQANAPLFIQGHGLYVNYRIVLNEEDPPTYHEDVADITAYIKRNLRDNDLR